MSDESCMESLERFSGATIASHSNCRSIAPGDRQLSDQIIGTLGKRDAVIGIAPTNRQLLGRDGQGRFLSNPTTLDLVVDHIDRVCQLTGDSTHVGLGTDMDGGFGVERTPQEFETYED